MHNVKFTIYNLSNLVYIVPICIFLQFSSSMKIIRGQFYRLKNKNINLCRLNLMTSFNKTCSCDFLLHFSSQLYSKPGMPKKVQYSFSFSKITWKIMVDVNQIQRKIRKMPWLRCNTVLLIRVMIFWQEYEYSNRRYA